jgi:hypothetical protein
MIFYLFVIPAEVGKQKFFRMLIFDVKMDTRLHGNDETMCL